MKTTLLGRTNLEVSAVGLGGGGHSRLGLEKYGEEHASNIVRTAFEEGIRFFDTAQAYGTEGAVGRGLSGFARDSYVLSTKFPPVDIRNLLNTGQISLKEKGSLTAAIDESLQKLHTDYLDMIHLHGVDPDAYEDVVDRFYPEMENAKRDGKIRFLGITEVFQKDTSHKMLARCLPEDLFDVIMVGYNLLNHSAEKSVFPLTKKFNVGVLCMFAIRNALSNPAHLKEVLKVARDAGNLPADVDLDDAFAFIRKYPVSGVIETGYRFCSAQEGIDVTLTGTGSVDHLRSNIASLLADPLPEELVMEVRQKFGNVDTVSGE